MALGERRDHRLLRRPHAAARRHRRLGGIPEHHGGGKITGVTQSIPVALEDASLSTWIHPTDGSGYLYYPKGSLAGFMLDILIRDASDNRRSLDDVMRQAYRNSYKRGRGFDAVEWWTDVRAAAGRDFPGFNDRYIDGREAYPWDSVLPLAGFRLQRDTTYLPRLGINTRRVGEIKHGIAPRTEADALMLAREKTIAPEPRENGLVGLVPAAL